MNSFHQSEVCLASDGAAEDGALTVSTTGVKTVLALLVIVAGTPTAGLEASGARSVGMLEAATAERRRRTGGGRETAAVDAL